MKITAPLALLSLTALFPLLPSGTPAAHACTIVDTTTQVAIHGSRKPAEQENNIIAGSDDNCFNNTIVGNTTQVGIGAGEIKQNNQGEYFVGGGDINNTGLKTPTIIVTPETQVDVYSPAHDETFLEHLRP